MTTTSDPISDMLTRMRNAMMARKSSVSLPYSKIKAAIAQILKDNGYIASVKVEENGVFKQLTVEFGPSDAITNLTRLSKPGRRVYTSREDIPLVLSGRGMVIVSTSSGVMSGREARKRGLGGELICRVY